RYATRRGARAYGVPLHEETASRWLHSAPQSPALRTHRARCCPGWRAVVRAVVVSHITDTRSLRAYRFSLSYARYPSTVPTIVTSNRLFTPTLPFMAKLCHLSDTKQRQPAQWSPRHGL